MVSKKKDSIGSTLSEREGLNRDDALMLVGFKPVDPGQDRSTAGSHFMNKDDVANANERSGLHDLGRLFAEPWPHDRARLSQERRRRERARIMRAVNPVQDTETEVEVVSAHFVDPEGERLRA